MFFYFLTFMVDKLEHYYAGFKSKTDCHTCKAKIAKSNGHALLTKSNKK